MDGLGSSELHALGDGVSTVVPIEREMSAFQLLAFYPSSFALFAENEASFVGKGRFFDVR